MRAVCEITVLVVLWARFLEPLVITVPPQLLREALWETERVYSWVVLADEAVDGALKLSTPVMIVTTMMEEV
jgi:hypothetical protein